MLWIIVSRAGDSDPLQLVACSIANWTSILLTPKKREMLLLSGKRNCVNSSVHIELDRIRMALHFSRDTCKPPLIWLKWLHFALIWIRNRASLIYVNTARFLQLHTLPHRWCHDPTAAVLHAVDAWSDYSVHFWRALHSPTQNKSAEVTLPDVLTSYFINWVDLLPVTHHGWKRNHTHKKKLLLKWVPC